MGSDLEFRAWNYVRIPGDLGECRRQDSGCLVRVQSYGRFIDLRLWESRLAPLRFSRSTLAGHGLTDSFFILHGGVDPSSTCLTPCRTNHLWGAGFGECGCVGFRV